MDYLDTMIRNGTNLIKKMPDPSHSGRICFKFLFLNRGMLDAISADRRFAFVQGDIIHFDNN